MSVEPGTAAFAQKAEAQESPTVQIVSPETLNSAPVSAAWRYWNALRGTRPFPARGELVPREMASFLRNIVLVRVIDGGKDYEYRIVGDAHVQAHGFDFRHLRLTQVEATKVDFSTRATYEHVRNTATPFAVRGWIGLHIINARFSYHESVFLPLGTNGVVDHLLIVSAYTPRGGERA
jgi:hypothetical protein